MDGRLSSLEKPIPSSWLPRRVNLGDSWVTSSLESLKKLPQTLAAMDEPLVPAAAHGGVGEVAVGGFREMDGMRPPDVSSTASCFRWSRKSLKSFVVPGLSQVDVLRGLWPGSFGGGAGGTVPGDISDSFSILHGTLADWILVIFWW